MRPQSPDRNFPGNERWSNVDTPSGWLSVKLSQRGATAKPGVSRPVSWPQGGRRRTRPWRSRVPALPRCARNVARAQIDRARVGDGLRLTDLDSSSSETPQPRANERASIKATAGPRSLHLCVGDARVHPAWASGAARRWLPSAGQYLRSRPAHHRQRLAVGVWGGPSRALPEPGPLGATSAPQAGRRARGAVLASGMVATRNDDSGVAFRTDV